MSSGDAAKPQDRDQVSWWTEQILSTIEWSSLATCSKCSTQRAVIAIDDTRSIFGMAGSMYWVTFSGCCGDPQSMPVMADNALKYFMRKVLKTSYGTSIDKDT